MPTTYSCTCAEPQPRCADRRHRRQVVEGGRLSPALQPRLDDPPGDGNNVSHRKIQQSLDNLWRFTAELFHADALELELAEQGIAVDPRELQAPASAGGRDAAPATLALPAEQAFRHGGKQGRHSEHLGPLLAEMQFLQRAYPNGQW